MKFGRFDLAGNKELYPFSYLIRRDLDNGLVIDRYEVPREETLG
jgi:hypothetical protein